MASPLAGAWEGGTDRFQGLIVFTDNYVSMHFVTNDRKTFQGDQPSEAEMAEAYQTLLGAAGPYTLSGSSMKMDRLYSRNPNATPVPGEYEVKIEGDQLTLTQESQGTFIMHKVE